MKPPTPTKANGRVATRVALILLLLMVLAGSSSTVTATKTTGTDSDDPVLLALLGGVIAQQPASTHHHNIINQQHRLTQQKTVYHANYIARVKLLLDLACSASKPILTIHCEAGGKLEILRTSHPSLVVFDDNTDTDDSKSTATVGSTCQDRADCERVFVTNEVNDEGAYGDIYVQCTGDSPAATIAQIETLPSSGAVECTAGTWTLDTRAFYIIELGIFCPPPDEDAVSDGRYVYASQFFECGGPSGSTLDEEYADDRYSCFGGRNCEGLSCTEDQIDPIRIRTEMTDALRVCIQETSSVEQGGGEALPAAVAVAPTPAPFTPPAGDYTMRHQALWSFQVDTYGCNGAIPKVEVSCLNGGTITLLEKVNGGVDTECDSMDDSTIVCDETNYDAGDLNGVIYECTGSSMDAARSQAVYLSSDAYCDTRSLFDDTSILAHRLRLGLFCGSALLGGAFEFNDAYMECGGTTGHGNSHNVENGADGYFECLEYKEVTIPTNNNGARENVTFPDVVIFTEAITSEDLYERMRANDCFTADFAPTAPTTVPAEPTPTPLTTAAPTQTPETTTTTTTSAPMATTTTTTMIGIPLPQQPTIVDDDGTPTTTLAPESYCLATCNCTATP